MNHLNLKPLLVALLTAGLATGVAFAEEAKGPNRGETKAAAPSESVQAVDNLLLARQLVTYAQSHKDALGLVVAARMIQDQPTQAATWTKEGGNEQASADLLSVDALLAQAREQSGGRADVLALIDETAKRGATKGRVGGPLQHADRVRGNHTDIYSSGMRFRGDEEATIGVIGDDNADIDCYVFDENGNLIDSDTDSTATCALEWYPSWTGPFTLKVKNTSSRGSDYLILTN